MRTSTRTLLISTIILAQGGCNRPAPAGIPVAAGGAPKVTVLKPEQRSVRRVVEQPGTVVAFEETALHAKVPGYLGTIADDVDKKDRPPHDRQIDIGSRVKKGQILAELHVPELEMEWKQKQAFVKQVEAEVVQAKKALAAVTEGIAAAKALVTEAEAGVSRAQASYERWQSEVTRLTGLVRKGVFEQEPLDETRNQFRAAEAVRNEVAARVATATVAVRKAEADRDKSAADVAAVRAKLEVAKADVERVEALRGYTKLRAPFDGVVTRRTANPGDLVTGNEKAGLFSVARTDPVRVVVNVPEADAGLVSPGQEVGLVFQTGAGTPKAGRVTRTSWSLEPGSRTLRAEVDLPNPQGAIRPGMYVNARLTVELPSTWTLPAAAISKFNDEPGMFLAEGGKAVRVTIRLGKGDGQHTQVKQYKKPASTEWLEVTGSERVAAPAAALSDGMQLPS